MTLLAGSIFSLGFRIALQGDNNPVMPPSAAQVPKYLHLVDADGNTLVPVLVPDGLTTPEGPVAGLRWTIPVSAAGFAELEAAIGQAQSDISDLNTAVDTAQSTANSAAAAAAAAQDTADALGPFAVYGGLWDVTNPITTDTPLLVGQHARVDMTGKTSGDPDGGIVALTLPLSSAGNKGRSISVGTINIGGADDGSVVRILTQGGQVISSGVGAVWNQTGEVRSKLVSHGSGWDVQSIS